MDQNPVCQLFCNSYHSRKCFIVVAPINKGMLQQQKKHWICDHTRQGGPRVMIIPLRFFFNAPNLVVWLYYSCAGVQKFAEFSPFLRFVCAPWKIYAFNYYFKLLPTLRAHLAFRPEIHIVQENHLKKSLVMLPPRVKTSLNSE